MLQDVWNELLGVSQLVPPLLWDPAPPGAQQGPQRRPAVAVLTWNRNLIIYHNVTYLSAFISSFSIGKELQYFLY